MFLSSILLSGTLLSRGPVMIEVEAPLYRCVGRPDFSQLPSGYHAGGAQDRFSHQLGNLLVGNTRWSSAFEVTLLPATFRFSASCRILLAGSPCEILLNGVSQAMWQPIDCNADDVLKVVVQPPGCRVMLCVLGGVTQVDTHQFLVNDAEPCSASRKLSEIAESVQLWEPPLGVVRVVPGPEFTAAMEKLLEQPWVVQPQSSGMGLRLKGPAMPAQSYDILSAPVTDGTIQATPTGLLALLRERGTLGGYPRVLTVIDCDVDRLAQFRPGQVLRFQKVDSEQAAEANECQQQVLARIESCCR